MDILTIAGLICGFGGILGGYALEGGHLSALTQLTAGFIVVGGTAGGMLVGSDMKDLMRCIKLTKLCFFGIEYDKSKILEEIVSAAEIARKESVLALEKQVDNYSNPFFKRLLQLIIDGTSPDFVKSYGDLEIEMQETENMAAQKLWADAGGFAPTIGIIGAVLGLIEVMKNLDDPSQIGSGIAVAFVATIYGLVTANIICLPFSNKLKRKISKITLVNEMILAGASCIQEGLAPKRIEEKLQPYIN